jgi:hypothetical protein
MLKNRVHKIRGRGPGCEEVTKIMPISNVPTMESDMPNVAQASFG